MQNVDSRGANTGVVAKKVTSDGEWPEVLDFYAKRNVLLRKRNKL